jgi:hypothetical protein
MSKTQKDSLAVVVLLVVPTVLSVLLAPSSPGGNPYVSALADASTPVARAQGTCDQKCQTTTTCVTTTQESICQFSLGGTCRTIFC